MSAILRKAPKWLVTAAANGFLLIGSLPAPAAAADRIIDSAEGFARERADRELRDPLSLERTVTRATDLVVKPRSYGARVLSTTASLVAGDAWIYEASADYFHDFDRDGYYRYLRARFDVDTIRTLAYVYAEIYVSADGEAWELLHTTKDFAVYGSATDDDYEVETELVSGYSTALYDVLIEIYDADTGDFLDEYGPSQSSAFSLLPLEDAYRDGVDPEPPPIIVVEEGGGAVSWWMLPGLLAAWLIRRRVAK